MAIVVQTVTTCDLCGAEDIRLAAEGYTPPVGWAEMVIRSRGDGAGWSNTGRPFDGVICPSCTGDLRAWIDVAIARKKETP